MATKKKIATSKKKLAEQEKKSRAAQIYAKKPHIEFIAAILSIPLFISIIILNFNNIKNLGNAKPTPTPGITVIAPAPNGVFYAAPVGIKKPATVNFEATKAPCVKGLGPISISSPGEGDTVSNNPVEVDIVYDDSQYCGAAWSYRVNGGDWSGYDDRSVALYNLPKGSITFELRVKSIAGSNTTPLTRRFTYNGQSAVFPTSASGSAH